MFGYTVSDLQENDVAVGDTSITGTLHYLDSGTLAETFGAGNFMALKFDVPDGLTSFKVGLYPTEGGGLVEIIDDPDKNGAFKVTDENTQVFRIEASDGVVTEHFDFDVSGLTLEESGESGLPV